MSRVIIRRHIDMLVRHKHDQTNTYLKTKIKKQINFFRNNFYDIIFDSKDLTCDIL